MKQLMRVGSFLIVTVLIFIAAGYAQQAAAPAQTDPLHKTAAKAADNQGQKPDIVQGPLGERADRVLREAEAGGFSGVALIAKDGEIVLRKGYGLANRAAKIPMTPDTVVQVGSCTKDFTVVSILQMHERGLLDVNDPITKYFDAVPEDKRAITIWQLIIHRAGFDTYLGGDFEAVSREELIQRTFRSKLLFAPGTGQSYSNPGYSLLAVVIEKVAKKSFDEYVRDYILTPLGLRDTGFLLPRFDPGRIAHGYVGSEDRGVMIEKPHAPDGPYWNLRGNGGMLSTVTDMFRFYSALWGDSLLKPATRDMRFSPAAPMMLAGSDGVHFFLYNREPAAGLDIILASNCAEFKAPAVRDSLAGALGLAAPDQRGQRVVETVKVAPEAGQQSSQAGGSKIVQRRLAPDNFFGDLATFNLPDTPAGRAAASWLRMLNKSDIEAMRRYIRDATAPSTADARALEERLESFRRLHERLGFLTPSSVEASAPYEITLVFRSVHQEPLVMVFAVEPMAPFRLRSVKVRE